MKGCGGAPIKTEEHGALVGWLQRKTRRLWRQIGGNRSRIGRQQIDRTVLFFLKSYHDSLGRPKSREIAQRIETSKDNSIAERASRYFLKDAEFHIVMADYLRRLERSALINVGLIAIASLMVVCLVSQRGRDGS